MSEETQSYRKEKSLGKAVGQWVGTIAAIVVLTAGFAKAYFVTPVVLDTHEKKIEKLESADKEFAGKLQEQRELLIEIRGDIKALNRSSRNAAVRLPEN